MAVRLDLDALTGAETTVAILRLAPKSRRCRVALYPRVFTTLPPQGHPCSKVRGMFLAIIRIDLNFRNTYLLQAFGIV